MVIAFFIVEFKTHSVKGIFLKTEKVANQEDMAMRCHMRKAFPSYETRPEAPKTRCPGNIPGKGMEFKCRNVIASRTDLGDGENEGG